MIIRVIRDTSTDKYMLGEFIAYVDGEAKLQGYTVERPWLGNEPYVSCIPTGTYKAFTRVSESNGNVIELKNVPGRTFIQFHVANYAHELAGCIGVGAERIKEGVLDSRSVMGELYALAQGHDITVEVVDTSAVPSYKPRTGEWGSIDPSLIPEWRKEAPKEYFMPVSYSNTIADFRAGLHRRFERRETAKKMFNFVVSVLSNRLGVPELSMLKLEQTNLKVNNMAEEAKGWLAKKLEEKSTYVGAAITVAVLILGYFGLEISVAELTSSVESVVVALSALIVALSGLYELFRDEKTED